ncbi:hypothetical protein H8356DRAFT_1369830 [Neocallimastix lanati (nom. inval.)]|nr:hypothetical protein H8356DRAFT_1369830 [Neocallimastix sp. JGI-2020a]
MDDQLEISETNKEEKNQIIVNRKYKFNLWYITNNTKIFQCTKYKTVKKCKSYIILNDNNKVIKYENKHTHPGKEYDASVSIFAPEINSFYTTSLSILNNKEQATYELLFEELKKNESNYNNNIIVIPKILNCDFEKSISNASIKIFHNITIKYCVWHYKRSFEVQKNKLCYNEVENHHKIYLLYKAITNFPFINPEYIFDIYNYIKIICQIYNYFNFLNFLEYFNKTYLYKYDIQYWNYYNDVNHITNNASESFNNYLKLFYKKLSFYELIYHLKREESLSYNNYKRKIEGVRKKKEY